MDKGSGNGCFFWLLVLVAVTSWLSYAFVYAPNHETAEPVSTTNAADPRAKASASILAQITQAIPDAEPRLQWMDGGNLDVYLTMRHFEEIPYPGRSAFVSRLGRTWCRSTSHRFMPSVRVRAVRTGENLATYSCVFSSAEIDR